jgi:hypothetical protein
MSSIFLLKYKEVFVSKYEIWGVLKEKHFGASL